MSLHLPILRTEWKVPSDELRLFWHARRGELHDAIETARGLATYPDYHDLFDWKKAYKRDVPTVLGELDRLREENERFRAAHTCERWTHAGVLYFECVVCGAPMVEGTNPVPEIVQPPGKSRYDGWEGYGGSTSGDEERKGWQR